MNDPKATQKQFLEPTAKPQTSICVHCQQPFVPKVFWQRFCNPKCHAAYHYQLTKRGRALVREQMEQGEL